MKKGKDIAAQFPGLYLVHHNLPGLSKCEIQFKDHLLFVPLQGEITLNAADKSFTLGPGRMLYLPPGVPHSFVASKAQGERLIALIDPKLWSRRVSQTHPISVVPLNQLLKEILFYLLLHPQTAHGSSLTGVLVETLSEGLELNSATNNDFGMDHVESRVGDPRVVAALEFMRLNLSHSISMNEVARKSGLSLRSLNRLVFEQTGLTPRNVLIRYRIAKAAELLLAPASSVTAVALDVGYASLGQFIAAFRAVTGLLPSEYGRLASSRSS